jgi:hypothetical protein
MPIFQLYQYITAYSSARQAAREASRALGDTKGGPEIFCTALDMYAELAYLSSSKDVRSVR